MRRVDALDSADGSTLSFIRSDKFARQWESSKACAAVVARGMDVPNHNPSIRALLVVRDADLALSTALELLEPEPPQPAIGVHPSAAVDPSAKIDPTAHVGAQCAVGANAVIGPHAQVMAGCVVGDGAIIGEGSKLFPRVCVLDACVIGRFVSLHSGVVIGADGFGYRPSPDGKGLQKIPQRGNVVIEDHVEIGANSCIDRARFGSTVIGAGTKIDNLVQIGHNCRVGRSCIICGCVGIAGSTVLGDGVQIGGHVGIGDNLSLGSGCKVAAKSGVICDIPPGQTWIGLPARPGRDHLRMLGAMRKLAGLAD